MFEILLEFSLGQDWEKAFYAVIPPRKVIGKPSDAQDDPDDPTASLPHPPSPSASLSLSPQVESTEMKQPPPS